MTTDEILRVIMDDLVRQADESYGELKAERTGPSCTLELRGEFDFHRAARKIAERIGTEQPREPSKLLPTEVLCWNLEQTPEGALRIDKRGPR